MIEIVAWLVIAIFSFQIVAQFIFTIGLRRLPRPSNSLPSTPLPVSVIIAVKDEAKHLHALLSKMAEQEYPDLEVILVDDGSVDQSLEIMTSFAQKHDSISVIKMDKDHHHALGGKKAALQTGIEHAKNEHLVFTDGDCEPFGKHWLTAFARSFGQGADVVVGTGFYRVGEAWFGGVYAADAVRSAMIYHALAALGRPYMCVGRSLGYTKSAFKRADGFLPHADLLTGSDDLLLQSFPKDVTVRSVPSALTLSEPPPDLGSWLRQRKRHLKAAPHYHLEYRGFLTAYDFSLLLTPLAFIWGCFQDPDIVVWVMGLFVLRTVWAAINFQGIINLSGRPKGLIQVWAWEYPASWMNALISVASLWAKERAWRIDR